MNAKQMFLVSAAGLMLAGCSKMTIEEMKAKMPGRPAELDQLDKMVGTWQGEDITVAPEMDDCRAAAETRKVAVRIVYDAAKQAIATGG